MSDRVEYFAVTIPAGTLQTALFTEALTFHQGIVKQITVKVPAGPSGLMGFFIGAGGTQYVPRTTGSFVVADDDYIVWPMHNAITSGSWLLSGYNTDIYDHTVYVEFQIDETGPPVGSASGAIGSSALATLEAAA